MGGPRQIVGTNPRKLRMSKRTVDFHIDNARIKLRGRDAH